MNDLLKSYRKNMAKSAVESVGKLRRGFTLIEILVVIGILAILATLVLVAVNPAKQFKSARDTKRAADVATVLSAVTQNMADHAGVFMCEDEVAAIPATTTVIGMDAQMFDLAPCVVPEYVAALPVDPTKPNAHWTNESDYLTGYSISADELGRVTISAEGENSETGTISATR